MKLIALMSSGIDSPVAAYKMAQQGAEVILLHMDNRPYAEDASSDDAIALAEQLRKATGKDMPYTSHRTVRPRMPSPADATGRTSASCASA